MKRTIEFNAHEVALLAQALDLEHEIYHRLSVYEGDRLKQKALLRKLKKWLRMENKRLLDKCFNELKEELKKESRTDKTYSYVKLSLTLHRPYHPNVWFRQSASDGTTSDWDDATVLLKEEADRIENNFEDWIADKVKDSYRVPVDYNGREACNPVDRGLPGLPTPKKKGVCSFPA